MKGSIKISTWQDVIHCRDIVLAAEPEERAAVAADVLAQITPQLDAIEERGYICVPIVETESSKKIRIRICGEIKEGAAIKTGGAVSEIVQIGKPSDTGAAGMDSGDVFQSVTLTKALPGGAEVLCFASPVDPYADFGAGKNEIEEIKEVLKSYE